MLEFKDYLAVVVFMFLFIAITLGGTLGAFAVAEKSFCTTMQTLNTNYDFNYDIWTGCMVKVNSTWYDASTYFEKTQAEIELKENK